MAHALYKLLLIMSITASSILTGCQLSLSYVSVATILTPPGVTESLMLSLWRSIFNRGFHLCPPLAFFSGLCCFINAFLTYMNGTSSVGSGQESSREYVLLIAGSLTVGIVPFTMTFIVPLEEILLAKEAKLSKTREPAVKLGNGSNGKVLVERSEESAAETRKLMKRWTMLNYVRTILPMAGALVAWSTW